MVELRLNIKTNATSWGFSDGKLFYPFENTEVGKAMATLLAMKYKTTKQVEEGLDGSLLEDWKLLP